MKTILNVTISMLLSLSASAATLDCPSLETIEAKAEDCDGNLHFSKAAQKCAQSFQAALLDVQLELTAGPLSPGGNAKAFDSALVKAITLAASAQAQVLAYRDHIYFPEDFDAPKEVIGDPFAFLDANTCYSENERYLESVAERVTVQTALLERAKHGDKTALRALATPAGTAVASK